MRTRKGGGVFRIHLPLWVAGDFKKLSLSCSGRFWWPSFPPRNFLLLESGIILLGHKKHLWLLYLPRSSTVSEHLSAKLPSRSPRGACLCTGWRSDTATWFPGAGSWARGEQAATHTQHTWTPPPPTPSGWQALGRHQRWNLPDSGNDRARGGQPLPLAPWTSNKGNRQRTGQLLELAGLKVTAKTRCRGHSQRHHSHLDSCTDLGKTASAPSSQGQSLSSTFGGLAGGPLWLLSQRWVFHLQLDSEQIPTTRNREQSEGRKACISSPLIPSLSVCHKSTLFLLEWELQHALFSRF